MAPLTAKPDRRLYTDNFTRDYLEKVYFSGPKLGVYSVSTKFVVPTLFTDVIYGDKIRTELNMNVYALRQFT